MKEHMRPQVKHGCGRSIHEQAARAVSPQLSKKICRTTYKECENVREMTYQENANGTHQYGRDTRTQGDLSRRTRNKPRLCLDSSLDATFRSIRAILLTVSEHNCQQARIPRISYLQNFFDNEREHCYIKCKHASPNDREICTVHST